MKQGQLVLYLGGVRSGKSALAEARVQAYAGAGSVAYLATARPLAGDKSLAQRLKAHQARRPEHWETWEAWETLLECMKKAARRPFKAIFLDGLGMYTSLALKRPQAAFLDDIEVFAKACRRQAGLTVPVLCLLGAPDAAHEEAVRAGVDLSAGSVSLVGQIAAAAQRAGRPARLHLKADTGMSRGGATAADWPAVVAAALAAEAAGHVQITAVWSHLACADIPGHPSTAAQLTAFRAAVELAERAGARPQLRHLANTPATLTLPETWFDLERSHV